MSGGPSILTIPRAPLNFQQSIFFPLSSAEFKPPKILIKCYPYQKNEQDRLRSMDRAPKKFIVSPVDSKAAGPMIFFATEIQQMSLQTFISLHKMKSISIEKQFLKSFVKTFDTLNKLHKAGLLHGNLKPSNIFITFPEAYARQGSKEINTDEIEWKLAEVGINPKSQNKYYSKSRLIEDNGSKSMFADPKENDYYSLGVILLEMATLDPIEKIHNDISNDKLGEKQYIEKMRKSESKQHFISTDLLDFIKALLNPKQLNSNASKVGGLNTLYHNYADPSKDKDENQATASIRPFIQYKDYFLEYEKIESFLTNNTIDSVLKKLKENIDKEEYKCSEILKFINRELDPEEEFFFPTSEEFFKFVYKYGKNESKKQDEDLFKKEIDSLLFSNFFTFESHIFYMPILMRLFKPADLADTVLKKAIDRYESSTQFFKDQTNNKDAWKAEDMFNFFHSIRVPFTPDDIQSILRTWAPNNKENTAINSLKLDDFKKVFKDYSSPKKTEKLNESDKKTKQKQERIFDMFKDLSKNHENLVNFFRRMPGQHNWQVPIDKVREQFKKYYKFRSAYEEKQIISQLLALGRLSETDKTIDYIRVLKRIAIYEPIDLFRKVLVERINEDGIGNIYKKYEKGGKGWNIESLQEFCRRQNLDFDEKHQNMFFNLLDKDDSGYINLKELMYKLTGIKEFDMEHIIETIKNSSRNDGDKVFDAFLKVDKEKTFVLSNPDELEFAFELIDDKLRFETSHTQQIYSKFINRKGKFEYLTFIRYFCDVSHIFMKICSILIDSMFKGEFEKFFKIGLKGDQRKWKRESLSRVNDMLVLGFKEKQLDEVWKKIDSNDQNSLTIEQVGEKFNKHVESFEEFKGRAVESLTDYRPKRKEQESKKNIVEDRNRPESRQYLKTDEDNNLEKNQLILDLKSMKLRPILVQCFKKADTASSVWIDSQKFCNILKEQSVSCTKKFLENSFPYCLKKTSTKTLFNYLKFFLLVAQFKKDPLKQKTECLRYVLNSFCKQKRIKANKIFQDFRVRDQMMKLSKFQTVIKDILEVADEQLFFEDINDVWIFFGDPQFINVKNLQRILDDEDSQRLRDFVRDQKEQKQNTGFDSRQRPTPTLRSRHDSQYQQRRKQSQQSADFRKTSQNQRQERNQRNRNQNDRTRKDSQSEWRNSEMQRKREDQERQRRDYERDRKQRQRKRQMEEERERERQRQREKQRERQRTAINRRRKDSEQQRDSEREEDKKKKVSSNKRTSMEDNLHSRKEKQKTVQLSKKDLISKLEKELEYKSTDELARLFMDKNKVDKDELTYCLTRYYDFGKKEAEDLGEHLSDFGQVKIETVKKYLRPAPKEKERSTSKDSPKKYGNQKRKTVQFNQKEAKKYGDEKMISPVTRQIKPQHRLSNPHKRKLNTPLIKEQIKMIIRSFSQKYAIEEIDKYFFDDSDIIYRDEFIKKCKGINTNLGEQNIEKIFEFLKPNEKDEVSIMNFKISFSFDENFQVQEDYLPKDLVKELQEIFNAHDKDKSGSIQPSEIQALLSTLGFNQTQKEIENVFQKIDKNFDNQISFSEFKDFIEDFILPHLIEFQNDVDQLFTLLKMNDVFNTGCVSLTVLLAIIERFGVKLTNQEGVFLAKYIGNQNDQIPIYDFLAALYYSSNPMFPPVVKSALYKIKLRRKISLKEIQKTFTNISSNFVMAYTSRLIKSEQLKRSTAFQPVLHQSYMFFNDFFYKDFRRIQSSKNDKVLVDDDPKATTALVEIRIPQAAGVPIPQNSNIKGAILKRAMNISFFDMSAENAKHCIISLEAEWDSEIEDQWLFDMKNRAFYLKIANYDARKFQKMILLFELVITMNDNSRIIDVSCGSASISVKELVSVDNKFSKKLKLVSGIPTKAKEIDKVSVTKRSGWKSFLGSSNLESQLSIDIFNQKNLDQKTIIPMLHAMPSICLVKRKSLHYIWAFREFFAERCVDRDCINPQFSNHHTVRAFLLSLDIDDISNQIVSFWRDKIEQFFLNKRQNLKTVWQSRTVMYHLLTDLHMILNSKQFELKMSNPCASVAQNKNLFMLRQKMVNQVLENIENFVKNDLGKERPYKRVKNYNYNYSPIAAEYERGSLQSYINQNIVKVGKVV